MGVSWHVDLAALIIKNFVSGLESPIAEDDAGYVVEFNDAIDRVK